MASSAVQIGFHDNVIPDLEVSVVPIDLDDLGGQFVTNDARVDHEGMRAAIDLEIASTDASSTYP